jgi:hypothetical protein
MTALAIPTRALNTATFDVFTRRVRSGTPPEIGLLADEADDWSIDYELRFLKLKLAAWPNSGYAHLDYVSLAGDLEPIENNLGPRYWVDDQIRIKMYPPTFSSGAPIGVGTGTAGGDADELEASSPGVTVFEGVMSRQSFGVRATDQRDDEDTGIVCVDGPTIDNLDPEHLVRGRWVQDPGESPGTPYLIDSPYQPAVFNAGGLPNMMPTLPMTAHDGGIGLSAKLFTGDGDYRATYWTARDALVSLLAMWLYGHSTASGTAKKRSATLETLTAQALLDDAIEGARWTGLDAQLDDVSVQGLGVYDAMLKVCRAAGFEMSVTPSMGRPPAEVEGEEEPAAIDRLYQIKLWRSGAGPKTSIKLQPRPAHNAASGSAEDELKANNTSELSGLVDATRVRNHVIATGPVLIETTVTLKPLWSPDDVDDATIDRLLQFSVPGNTDAGTAYTDYAEKHIEGGAQFATYGHVGRLWGLDCTGQVAAEELGYASTPAAYVHDEDGFDWLTHLSIDNSTDALSVERAANHVTDDIRWSVRPRAALPLRRAGIGTPRQPYILRVSENGGSSWTELPSTSFKVHADRFAVYLQGIKNLATVNANTLAGDGAPADIDASWWYLISTGNLLFDLTCLVEADHAQRYDAKRQDGAGTLYSRAVIVASRAPTIYASPSSILNGSSWVKLDDGGYGDSTAGADREQQIQDLAERVRDAQAPLRVSLAAGTWLMDPALWQPGDRVTSIEGRGLGLRQTTPKGEQRSPSIVSVTLTGYPEDAQGVAINLQDEAMRRGV